MLRPMFGMGGSEILVILIVALLFLGPEKLPDAAAKISKGIRDLRKQTRELTNTIENDTEIGGAIRDLKSALRGEEPRPRVVAKNAKPKPKVKPKLKAVPPPEPAEPVDEDQESDSEAEAAAPAKPEPKPAITMPETAGEPADLDDNDEDGVETAPNSHDDAELAEMIKPAPGVVAKQFPAKAAAPDEKATGGDDDGEQKAG